MMMSHYLVMSTLSCLEQLQGFVVFLHLAFTAVAFESFIQTERTQLSLVLFPKLCGLEGLFD